MKNVLSSRIDGTYKTIYIIGPQYVNLRYTIFMVRTDNIYNVPSALWRTDDNQGAAKCTT